MLRFLLIISVIYSNISWAVPVECVLSLETGVQKFDTISVNANNGKVIIPIYSDVHGRVESLFKSVGLLQKKTKQTYPTVLITGDLGWFPYPDDLSPKLKQIEIKSATDRGFANFTTEEATDLPVDGGRRTLRQRYFEDARTPLRLDTKFYALRGNHEDHELLKDREQSGHAIIPLDGKATFNYLADGRIVRLTTPDGAELRIGILGGIHRETRPGRSIDNPLMTFDEVAINRLLGEPPGSIDVLLTHQGPEATHGGHSEVDALIEVLRPKVHAHGHSGHAQAPVCIGETRSRCVPDLDRPRDGTLALEWDVARRTVKLIEL